MLLFLNLEIMFLTFLQLSEIFVYKVSCRLWKKSGFCICGRFLPKQTNIKTAQEIYLQLGIEFIQQRKYYYILYIFIIHIQLGKGYFNLESIEFKFTSILSIIKYLSLKIAC